MNKKLASLADKVAHWSTVRDGIECIEWGGSIGRDGYGKVKHNGKTIRAHRASFMVNRGEIPRGMLVCHSCDNRRCVNHRHMFLGTVMDNYNDMVSKGRNRVPSGDGHYNAKIPDSSVADIVLMRSHGRKLRDIASIYGVSIATICDICKGRTRANSIRLAPCA